jgi:hypothetical protein
MKTCDKINSLIHNIFIHCHPPNTATNSGEQTVALYQGLADFACGKANSVRHMFYSNIYIQQAATLHNLLYLRTALHDSGGTTAHHQER